MLSKEQIHALYEQFGPLLYQRCQHLLGNEPEAQDALQEIFYLAFRYRKGFRNEAPPLHWLHRITTHTCVRFLQKRTKQEGLTAKFLDLSQKEYDDPATDSIQRDLVCRLLNHFDARTQRIVVSTFVEGLLQDEISEIMNISTRAVRKRLTKFYQKAEKLCDRWESHSPQGTVKNGS